MTTWQHCLRWMKIEQRRRSQKTASEWQTLIYINFLVTSSTKRRRWKKNEQSHDDSRIHMFVACILAIIVQLITYLCTSLCNCLFYLYCMCCCHFLRALLSHLFTHFTRSHQFFLLSSTIAHKTQQYTLWSIFIAFNNICDSRSMCRDKKEHNARKLEGWIACTLACGFSHILSVLIKSDDIWWVRR